MLASAVELNQLQYLTYPLRMQIKYDGIRAIGLSGKLVSRTLKPIRNRFVQEWYGEALTRFPWMEHCDGELIVGDPSDSQCYHNTNSGVMSGDGEPNFTYYIFDTYGRHDLAYHSRRELLQKAYGLERVNRPNINATAFLRLQLAEERHVCNAAEVEAAYGKMLSEGHEGAILRSLDGRYKFGRSTLREGWLLKLKSFADAEAVITGFEELMRNGNAANTDARGYTVRSAHAGNLEPGGMLGNIQVRCDGFSESFCIGTGFDEQTRISLWAARDSLRGRIIKFKYMTVGVKDRPRHPVFLGFRDPSDM